MHCSVMSAGNICRWFMFDSDFYHSLSVILSVLYLCSLFKVLSPCRFTFVPFHKMAAQKLYWSTVIYEKQWKFWVKFVLCTFKTENLKEIKKTHSLKLFPTCAGHKECIAWSVAGLLNFVQFIYSETVSELLFQSSSLYSCVKYIDIYCTLKVI